VTAETLPAAKRSVGPMIARLLFGLFLLVFGSFGLLMALHVVPMPKTPMPPEAMDFSMALGKTGYMMPMISLVECIVGLMLLTNRYVPLALTLIAPLLVNIILFHAFLQPAGIVPGAIITVLEIYLALSYRSSFRSVLAARALPG
jgi:hypothetical protein